MQSSIIKYHGVEKSLSFLQDVTFIPFETRTTLKMSIFEDNQVNSKELKHLGLVAGTIKKIHLVKKIDKLLPVSKQKGANVTIGERAYTPTFYPSSNKRSINRSALFMNTRKKARIRLKMLR